MKPIKRTLLPAALLAMVAALAMAASAPALAQRYGHGHGHGPSVHFGIGIGVPVYPYWRYPRPYYYYPPAIVTVPAAPPTTYIERGSASDGPDSASYWYYCNDTQAYYPYVKSCLGGWQRVDPQPAPG